MRDPTHDLALTSWVSSAQAMGTDFPIQNLPLGVFETADGSVGLGVAIGDQVVDLCAAREAGLLAGLSAEAAATLEGHSLNALVALGRPALTAVRVGVQGMLRADTEAGREAQRLPGLLHPMAGLRLRLPVEVGDYTDFYASIDHATNVGSMFRPDNPLLPNYRHVPIGYHGRASSIVPTGTPVHRPMGQVSAKPEGPPTFAPTARLDYELEVGAVIGPGNAMGTPITL
ncbi:MAG: fumarylacetoacetate hydrolase family protein, partial [Gemmatimonadaceae bacterium]